MKKILIGAAGILVVVILVLSYVVSTESGLVLLVRSLEKISMGNLHVSEIEGKIIKKFSFGKLYYESSDTLLKINHFEFYWKPAELRQRNLHVVSCVIEDVEYSSDAGLDDQSEEKTTVSLPHLKLPLNLLLDDLRVRNVQIISAEETVAEIDRIDLQMAGGAALLQLNTVYLQGDQYELSLSGNVGLNDDWPVDIGGKWRYLIEGAPDLQGTLGIVDSLQDAGVEIVLDTPYNARLSGRMRLDDGGLNWDAQLEANEIDPAIMYSDVPGRLNVLASTEGTWKEDILNAALSIEDIEGSLFTHSIDVKGDAKYDGDYFELDGLVVKSGEAGVTVNGKIGETLDLSYTLHPLDINSFVSQASGVVSGEGTVLGEFLTPVIKTVLVGNELGGEGITAGEVNADVKVEILNHLQESKINAAVGVKDINIGTQYVDRATVDVSGSLKKHTLHLEAFRDLISTVVSAHGGWKENKWIGDVTRLNLVYADEHSIKLERPVPISAGIDNVDIGDMCLKHESSTLCLNGQVRDKRWMVEVGLQEFNPAYFFEEWPGALNINVRGEGQISGDAFSYAFDVTSINGFLKGVSVDGSGKISQSGNVFKFYDVRLMYGAAQIEAEGQLSDTYDVNFQAEIPELHKLTSEIKGKLNASGAVYGPIKQPVIDLDIHAKDVSYADFLISNLYGDIGVDLHNEGRVEAVLRGSGISSNGVEISAASLLANGTTANHSFMINAETGYGTVEIQGRGNYDTIWQGVLESGKFTLGEYGTWILQKDSVLEVGQEKSRLENFCLYADDAHICLQGSFFNDSEWSAQASIESIPLKMFNNAGLGDIPLQGKLDGSVDASGDLTEVSSFKAKVKAGQILLQDRWQGNAHYTFSESDVTAVLEEENLLVTLGSRFEENGKLAGSLVINDIKGSGKDIALLPITGSLDFNVGDISFVAILTDDRYRPKGRLLGKLDISGVLGDPIIIGNVGLQNGEVLVTDLGILLEDISIELRSDSDKLNYTIKARSGPGDISSNGVITFENRNGFVVSGGITGKEFEIMNTDEYQFYISPDLQLEYGGNRDSLIGSLEVPFGRITFQGGSGQVTSTDDVVIVDAEEPVKKRDSQFFSDIDVTLGDDVSIDAYGLKSNLAGAFRLINEPGKNLSALGELIVLNGQFSLYSAELDITRGRLLFSGGDVENPGVDFQAQRKIDKKLVGVNVSGTAQDLEFQLFSDPAMEESNILAYILFGRAMYDSSGAETSYVAAAANALGIRGVNTVTNKLGRFIPVDEIYLEGDANEEDLSIVLGKHLTKDLFIGYGHNLFNELGEFKVKYQLGYNFSIETNSSVESTSGDIIYTIEK